MKRAQRTGSPLSIGRDASSEAAAAAPSRLPGGEALDLTRFLPYRLAVISFRVGQEIATLYRARFRLQQQEWKVLSIIASYGSLRSTELTKHGTLDRVTVSRVLTRLERRRLVQRRPHPRDRRTYHVTLSERGWEMYREIAEAAKKKEAEILLALGESEQKALFRLLSKLDEYFDRRQAYEDL
jgi:DNA-binding MarR family transcriptional regulator